jgi:formylmethanofuran dehydrogenase subunit E
MEISLRIEYLVNDFQTFKDKLIDNFGEEEFRTILLTNEFHGHIGIYSILGAKMGLFAKKIMGSNHNKLLIKSFAGIKPPESCLNDGLQVSTGSTLGQGLFFVETKDKALISVEFSYEDKTVIISLKEAVKSQIDSDIRFALTYSGGRTNEYWKKIREIAMNYWLDLDKNSIFNIQYSTLL